MTSKLPWLWCWKMQWLSSKMEFGKTTTSTKQSAPHTSTFSLNTTSKAQPSSTTPLLLIWKWLILSGNQMILLLIFRNGLSLPTSDSSPNYQWPSNRLNSSTSMQNSSQIAGLTASSSFLLSQKRTSLTLWTKTPTPYPLWVTISK